MNAAWLLLLLPLAASSGWWLASRRGSDKASQHDFNQTCLQGINQLLTLDDDEALQSFLETMSKQPKSVELQLVLGSLCRKKGEYERASMIHQAIVQSDEHDESTREQAQFELAQDYQAAGWLDRAEALYVELAKSRRFTHESATNLLRIYHLEKDWENAVQTAQLLLSSKLELTTESEQNLVLLSEQLSHFYCELCELHIKQGKFPRAEKYLAQAVLASPLNPRVIILQGRMAVFKGKPNQAIESWDKLRLTSPMFLGVAISHIRDSFELLQNSDAYYDFLKRALKTCQEPELLTAVIVALKADKMPNARHFFMDYLKSTPSIAGLKQILLSWQEVPSQISRDELLFLVETMASLLQEESRMQCKQCGFKTDSFEWSCAGCHQWGSYQRLSTKLNSKDFLISLDSLSTKSKTPSSQENIAFEPKH